MTATLSDIGRLLYGDRWRADMRRGLQALGYRVSQPTVDRWDEQAPPPAKWAEPIAELVAARIAALQQIAT